MKKIMVFGTFDILHEGHKYFLKEAKKRGDYLITVIAKDSTVKKNKEASPHNDENVRLEKVKKLNISDEVIMGDKDDPYKIILKKKPDLICLGYDQTHFVDGLHKLIRDKRLDIDIKRISSFKPEEFKSSIFKKRAKA